MLHFKQTGPKTCNIACLQMVGSYYKKKWSEVYIVNKLKQHTFGNWLPEMAAFLEGEGIGTNIYTNSETLPRRDNEKPTLIGALENYSKIGEVIVQAINKKHLNEYPAIINIDRSKLYGLKKGKLPHYVVLLKTKHNLMVYDPLNDEPQTMSFEKVHRASIDINVAHQNGLLLICKQNRGTLSS